MNIATSMAVTAPAALSTSSSAPSAEILPFAIITIVRDLAHLLGKHFQRNADGSISKNAAVNVSLGMAEMRHVPTPEAFVELLMEVSNDPSAAIINSAFLGIPLGEPFLLLSARELEARTGIPDSDRERQAGIHLVTHEGKPIKAVGRFKENVRVSSWQLFDRDINEHTPPEFASMTAEEWFSAVGKILPGLDQVTTVHTASTSSRVCWEGQAVGGGNGHTWVQFSDPEQVERLRPVLMGLAAKVGLTWLQPRFSRKNPTEIVAQSLTTVMDVSVLTPGRFVFIGQPRVSGGLTVSPISPTITPRLHATFDASAIEIPDANALRKITRKAGVEMHLSGTGNGLTLSVHDLTLDTEVETEHEGILCVRELLERGTREKVRCQTPFRASQSFAAFYNVNGNGHPFIHDTGTSTTHWLDQEELPALELIKAHACLKTLLPLLSQDPNAILEDEAIAALATIQQHKNADYQRKRAALKQASSKVSLTAVDMAVKAHVEERSAIPTHHSYARAVLADLTYDQWKPVSFQGRLFALNPNTYLWNAIPLDALIRQVAASHDGKYNCDRRSDYRAIAEHAISLASDDNYFTDAPVGIACPNGFYRIGGDRIVVEPLRPDHRQRVMLAFSPDEVPTPLFDAFLHETFASPNAGEEDEQRVVVQEVFGATLLGLMPRFQKAVKYFDPFGRAGKGTLMACQTELVPSEFVTAVSPFNWGKDYFVASLAGARLNVVGELPDNESIPAAMFKTVIGGDLITGRHPTHRPITFKNEAAHVFMSNYLINTRDHTEAFFARWLIVEFPNSRLRSGLPLDSGLADRIIKNEMPGIAYWALQGAVRLMRNGRFSTSRVHERLMAKWRRTINSLEEFIDETCELVSHGDYRRSEFYKDYTKWCSENGRKAFAKGRVKELLEHNLGLGIRLVEVNGYELFRGIQVKPPKRQTSTKDAKADTSSARASVPCSDQEQEFTAVEIGASEPIF